MRTIKLKEPKKVVTVEEVSTTTDELSLETTDTGDSVFANIQIGGASKKIILWEGDEYLKVGNWTDEMVNERILELI